MRRHQERDADRNDVEPRSEAVARINSVVGEITPSDGGTVRVGGHPEKQNDRYTYTDRNERNHPFSPLAVRFRSHNCIRNKDRHYTEGDDEIHRNR